MHSDGRHHTAVVTRGDHPGGTFAALCVVMLLSLAGCGDDVGGLIGSHTQDDDIRLTETYVVIDLTTGAVTQVATVPDLLTNDEYRTTQLVLKRIEFGSFEMGDEVGGHVGDELPLHTVDLTQPCYVGVFEVTQKQWEMVAGDWPSAFTTSPDMLPVEQVSWDDIKSAGGFMDVLTRRTSIPFRLPTEAEWERCCKAGTSTNYSYGDTADDTWMWCATSSGAATNAVGTTTNKPNPWGIFDLHGNVREWCEDYYDAYPSGPVSDPDGPSNGFTRVVRGGAWDKASNDCRSATRDAQDPSSPSNSIGFRVAAPGFPAPPEVTAHPSDQTVDEGQTATFTVTAIGAGTVTYRWRKNGANVSGATAATYTTPVTTIGDSGALYTCVVTNAGGSTASNEATLTVNMLPPQITVHPSDRTVTEGQVTTFTVTATSSGAMTYQWKKDGVDVTGGTGATQSTYTTPVTTLADSGAQFTCVVLNATGSVESDPGTLTVNMAPPTITGHPTNSTVNEGQTATFSVSATGSGTLTYQWKKNGTNVTGGSGGTTSSYTTPVTYLADSGSQFSCVVSNAAGSTPSNAATLTVTMDTGRTYMIVALSSGAVSYSQTVPDLETNAAYKTTHLVLKRIMGGTFEMGDLEGYEWSLRFSRPAHTVNITKPFYMGVFEVTQQQWTTVVGSWGFGFPGNPKEPAETVSWNDITGWSGFNDTLSSRTSIAFRLPTEAEWEYSCRAGTSGEYFYGDTYNTDWMWTWENCGWGPEEVATTVRKPNPWGLYDMHGNVCEWCSDWFDEAYYADSPTDDPMGPASSPDDFRVVRDGSWSNSNYGVYRAPVRNGYPATWHDNEIGFRVAATVSGP